jgi:hypothetical protein
LEEEGVEAEVAEAESALVGHYLLWGHHVEIHKTQQT